MDCVTTWKWKRAVRWHVIRSTKFRWHSVKCVSLSWLLEDHSRVRGWKSHLHWCRSHLMGEEGGKIQWQFWHSCHEIFVTKANRDTGGWWINLDRYQPAIQWALTVARGHCSSSLRRVRCTHATQKLGDEADAVCSVSQLGPLATELLWLEEYNLLLGKKVTHSQSISMP